jgi:hypothetical protein
LAEEVQLAEAAHQQLLAHLAEEARMAEEAQLQHAQLEAASSEEKGIVGEAKPATTARKSLPRSEVLGVNDKSLNEEEGIFHIKKKTGALVQNYFHRIMKAPKPIVKMIQRGNHWVKIRKGGTHCGARIYGRKKE